MRITNLSHRQRRSHWKRKACDHHFPFTAIGFAADGERGGRIASLSLPVPVAAPFLRCTWPSTLPLLCLWCAHGARTAKLLRAWPLAKQLLSRSPQGRGAGGEAIGKSLCSERNAESHTFQLVIDPAFGMVRTPQAPRQWQSIGFVFGLREAVLPCAPCARTKGSELLSNWQSASKNAPATGQDRERLVRITTLSRPLPAKGKPLALPLACAKRFCRARPVRAPKEVNC